MQKDAKKDAKKDVLIVGCSMLGNIAALLLAHYGLQVVVVEKKELPDLLLSKTARIDDEVMMLLEQLGLAQTLLEKMHPLKGIQISNQKKQLLLQFNHPVKSEYAPLYGFYQPDVQQLLQKEALQHPNIQIISACEVEAFEEGEDSIQVYIRPVKQHQFETIEVDYLMVCNGQFSKIADYIDIDVEQFNYESSVLCVDTASDKRLSKTDYAQTIYNSSYPVTCFAQNEHKLRFEFQLDRTAVRDSVTPDKVRSLIDDLSTAKDLTIESALVYSFKVRMLDKWHLNRVLIAGDAAHLMPPFLGMGLSAGIKDVHNLAWKLAWVQQGIAKPNILHSYQQERTASIRALIQLNLWVRRLFQSSKLRWIKGLVPIIPKWLKQRKLNISNFIQAGIQYPARGKQVSVHSFKLINHRGKKTNFNSIMGQNFAIIGINRNPVDALKPRQIEIMARCRTRFFNMTSTGRSFQHDGRVAINIYDVDGAMQRYLKSNKATYVVVRPDRLVYAFCKNDKALNEAVRQLEHQIDFIRTDDSYPRPF